MIDKCPVKKNNYKTKSKKFLLNKIQKLENLVDRDELTGLYNFRYLKKILDIEISRAVRYQYDLSVLYLDLDNFKELNDTKGHEAGNRVLQKVAKVLISNCRKSNIIARYGGDEFVIILPSADKKTAEYLAKQLKRLIYKKARIKCSIGVSTKNKAQDNILNSADKQLYKEKRRKKISERLDNRA